MQTLRILGWSGYDEGLRRAFAAFEADSGIRVSFRGVRNQDEMFEEASTGAFDVACPTTDRLASWYGAGLIRHLNDRRVGFDGIETAFHADAQTLIEGRRYGSPNLWGGAGIGYDPSIVSFGAGRASLMDLFDPAHAGRLAMREDTAMVAAGRALEASDALPFAFDDSYRSEARMRANYDVIVRFLIGRRRHVARFWFSEDEAIEAFASRACAIGYNWDTTIAALRKRGLPFMFMAPAEGANCYLQNFVVASAAPPGAAEDWIAWVNAPRGGALYAAAYGAFSPVRGARAFMSSEDRAYLEAAYAPEALRDLWWQPTQPLWFVRNREIYARQYVAAGAD